MSYVLSCEACERTVEVWYESNFHREEDGTGPYCDQCWFFIERIAELEREVKRQNERWECRFV